ncbi:MAG TPA: AAA family ATPase [Rhodobiaceae bacterium]|mgnify:FL=1|nr:MAG: Transcriptional regulatory protein GlrR [Rhodobiaceae bacterium UBA7378]HCQ81397.1 AAA family ATPase [Rhodobiaceae bacterium]
MGEICILSFGLSIAQQLSQALTARMAKTTIVDDVTDQAGEVARACHALVMSEAMVEKLGGPEALLEFARKAKARNVLIIQENADAAKIACGTGGRVWNMALPGNASDADSEFGVQMAATLVSEARNVAVSDDASVSLLTMARRVAATDVTVFINGPTGTGKEVLARFVHNNSTRGEQPFVAVNCAAIPENMLEAILFGHEKGSFTGASSANKGIFRAADGGTLLLDEISEMPMSLQAKLLRVLQEKAVTPIGAHQDIAVDVRVLATSNRDMMSEIRDGKFREDLYYRLNVFPLTTLHLSARRADIIPISTVLLKRHCENKDQIPWLSSEVLQVLTGYDWPGNVRELENVLQRALVLCEGNVINASDIITDPSVQSLALATPTDLKLQHVGS